MNSDVVHISGKGVGVSEALDVTERVANYASLDRKEAIRLRLIAEEMTGMLQAVTGEPEADFSIEADGKTFILHLDARTVMDYRKKEKLLSVSSSGKNEAARGFMGKIRTLFDNSFDASAGWYGDGTGIGAAIVGDIDAVSPAVWSLSQYKANVKAASKKEEWDELEKSVVAKLADEIKVGIKNDTVEMTVFIKF